MLKMLYPPKPIPKITKQQIITFSSHCLINELLFKTLLYNKGAHILNWRRNIPMFMLRLESSREICKREKGYKEPFKESFT